jgi:DNA-binding MarR family transcriptional regulator
MLLLLEKRGFVARTPDPSDGRVLSVALTPTGRKVYAALWKAGKPVRTRLLGSLGPGESQTLLDLVSRSMAPPDDRNSHSQDPSRTRS